MFMDLLLRACSSAAMIHTSMFCLSVQPRPATDRISGCQPLPLSAVGTYRTGACPSMTVLLLAPLLSQVSVEVFTKHMVIFLMYSSWTVVLTFTSPWPVSGSLQSFLHSFNVSERFSEI